jgi:hypothetical protein
MGRQRRTSSRKPEYPAVRLSQIAWLTTVGICVLTALILLLKGFDGYAALVFAVGLSAAINLR